MKTRLKAFTLNEIVIVMIISTIVIGMAFTVLSLVQRHISAIQQNLNINTEFNRLEQALWIDTINYNAITYDEPENELSFITELDSITYRFDTDYVTRGRDTFNISIANKVPYFNGSEVTLGKVDAVRLGLGDKYKGQNIFVFKYNDAKQFMD